MKRPLESEYTSHVGYTRALEDYCNQLEKAAKQALESMCWASRVMNVGEDEAPGFHKAIAALQNALKGST